MSEGRHCCTVGPIPRHWYNASAAFPELFEPYFDPGTGREVDTAGLNELFAPELVEQELDRTHRLQRIPDEVLERYAIWRPTPLVRAAAFERQVGTSCRIFYKYEGASPVGSHKANSGVAQAYFAKRGGALKLFAETGAGQWGSAISMGAAFFGLNCEVFMVASSYDRKPARRVLMETFGARVHRSPSDLTQVGRDLRAKDSESAGNLGIAIAEAVEVARGEPTAAYALGSGFSFVGLHQSVIGLELRSQLKAMGIEPDALVSCIGGGSSFAGLVFPFLEDAQGTTRRRLDLVAVESNAVPKVTRGAFTYDYGDTVGLTPLMKMYTLGHQFAAPSIHSGGLRYHGLATGVSKLIELGFGRAVAYSQLEVFRAATDFARAEGIVPAPESAHAIAAIRDMAIQHRDGDKTLVFCLTGHGFFDLAAYNDFNQGRMEDSATPQSEIEEALGALPPDPMKTAIRSMDGHTDAFESWRRWHFGGELAARDGVSGDGVSGDTNRVVDLRGHAVVSARVVAEACMRGYGDLVINSGTVVTPAGRGEARDRGRRLVREDA